VAEWNREPSLVKKTSPSWGLFGSLMGSRATPSRSRLASKIKLFGVGVGVGWGGGCVWVCLGCGGGGGWLGGGGGVWLVGFGGCFGGGGLGGFGGFGWVGLGCFGGCFVGVGLSIWLEEATFSAQAGRGWEGNATIQKNGIPCRITEGGPASAKGGK